MGKRKGVRLFGALEAYFDEELELRATDDGLVLYDDEGEVVTEIPNADVPLRIKFPSFWASIRNLIILDDQNCPLEFQPDPKSVARVRKLIDECLCRDPERA